MTHKTCSCCKIEKSLSEFGKLSDLQPLWATDNLKKSGL